MPKFNDWNYYQSLKENKMTNLLTLFSLGNKLSQVDNSVEDMATQFLQVFKVNFQLIQGQRATKY